MTAQTPNPVDIKKSSSFISFLREFGLSLFLSLVTVSAFLLILSVLLGCSPEASSVPPEQPITTQGGDTPTPDQPAPSDEKTLTALNFAGIKEKILAPSCLKCHGEKAEENLRLDSLDLIKKSNRALVIPGNAEDSALMIAVLRRDTKQMPPKGPRLSDSDIALLEQWINEGAL